MVDTPKNKDKYCEVIGVADNLLQCKNKPSEPQLCDMTKKFTTNFCGNKPVNNDQKMKDFSAIMNYKLKVPKQ